MKVFTATALGSRDNQQDSCFAIQGYLHGEPFIASGVADGVGSGMGGAEAARAVILALAAHLAGALANLNDLYTAFRAALRDASRHIHEFGSGASTATAAVVLPNTAHILNIGDSPAVLYSGKHDMIGCATREFSKAADLYHEGAIEKPDFETHPFRSMLTSYVSANAHTSKRVHARQVPLDARDRLLLCTDGLTNAIPTNELQHILAGPDLETCALLLELELFQRADDNASFVLIGNDYPVNLEPDSSAFDEDEQVTTSQTPTVAEAC